MNYQDMEKIEDDFIEVIKNEIKQDKSSWQKTAGEIVVEMLNNIMEYENPADLLDDFRAALERRKNFHRDSPDILSSLLSSSMDELASRLEEHFFQKEFDYWKEFHDALDVQEWNVIHMNAYPDLAEFLFLQDGCLNAAVAGYLKRHQHHLEQPPSF